MTKRRKWATTAVVAGVLALGAWGARTAMADDTAATVKKVEGVICDALSELNPVIAAICSLVSHHGAAELALLADADGDGKPDGDPQVIAHVGAMGDTLRDLIDREAKRINDALDGPTHHVMDWLHKHLSVHHHRHAPPAGDGS